MKRLLVLVGILLILMGCNSQPTDTDLSDSVSENLSTIEGTALFENIYVPFASREQNDAYISVVEFIENSGYEYTAVAPSTNDICQITVPDTGSDDYVYFAFCERDSGEYTIMTLSYYRAETKSEVSFLNYSTDGSRSYDQLRTHVIGESEVSVGNVNVQRIFLFAN